ncbi:UNVERIFIED_CONTAM: Protein BPS1, chloroplastic [Sesamum indicum]
MSRPQEPHRPFLSFGNPFRMISPKGSYLSPKLLALLNTFEETLAGRIKKLKPEGREDVLRLSWMRFAMETLCGIHTDIKSLITALELPVCDWDEKWIDVYLDNSVKLLDICIAFSSEISRLKQGHLFLQCVLHNLGGASSKQFVRARSSLDGWRQHIASKNPRLDNCFCVMDGLVQTLDLPKIKNSSKGKVLMRAMYGVKVVTLLVCSIFAATFSGSAKRLIDLKVPETYLWAEAFADLQTFVNTESRSICSSGSVTVLKELEAVDSGVKKLYPIVQDGADPVEAEVLQDSTSDLGESSEKLSQGLDLLAKEVDRFFQIVLTGRDALLCNLRIGGNISDQVRANKNVEGPTLFPVNLCVDVPFVVDVPRFSCEELQGVL